MAYLLHAQSSPSLPTANLRRSSPLIHRPPPTSVRFPLVSLSLSLSLSISSCTVVFALASDENLVPAKQRCKAVDSYGGNSDDLYLLTGDTVPESALLSRTRLEDAINKNSTRLRIFSGTANPSLAQVRLNCCVIS